MRAGELWAHTGLGSTSSQEPVPGASPHREPRGHRCLRAACSRHTEPTAPTSCGEGSCGRTPRLGQHCLKENNSLKVKQVYILGYVSSSSLVLGEQDGECKAGACSGAEYVRGKLA